MRVTNCPFQFPWLVSVLIQRWHNALVLGEVAHYGLGLFWLENVINVVANHVIRKPKTVVAVGCHVLGYSFQSQAFNFLLVWMPLVILLYA